MASLYTNFALQREVANLAAISKILSEFSVAFENQFVANDGNELLDEIFNMGLALENMWTASLYRDTQRATDDAVVYSKLLSQAHSSSQQARLEHLLWFLSGMKVAWGSSGGVTNSVLAAALAGARGFLGQLATASSSPFQSSIPATYFSSIDMFAVDVNTNTVVYDSNPPSTLAQYLATPCLQQYSSKSTVTGNGGILANSVDSAGNPVGVAYVPFNSVVVCIYVPTSSLESDITQSTVQPMVTTINQQRMWIYANSSSNSSPWTTPRRTLLLGSQNVNAAMAAAAKNQNLVGLSLAGQYVVADVQTYADTVSNYRSDVIYMAENLNWGFIRTTEIVVSSVDPTTNKYDCQSTSFRFNTTCYEDCYRTPEACRNAFTAYSTQSATFQITPDYRPEPCMGAYTWLHNGIDVSLGLERDVLEVRGLAVEALSGVLNSINSKRDGSLMLHLVRYVGMPSMPVFDIHGTCPDGECRVSNLDNIGIIFRKDCAHCMRKPSTTYDSIEYITDLYDCNPLETNVCNIRSRFVRGVAELAVDNVSSGVITDVDYRGVTVLAAPAFTYNLSVGVIVKRDEAEVVGPAQNVLIISACSGVAMALAGLALLIMVCRGMLNRIEREFQEISRAHETAVEAANAIANMDLDSVAYLKDLYKPNAIQRSLIRILTVLEQYKAFLPASVFASNREAADDETSSNASENSGSTRSSRSRVSASKQSMDNASRSSYGARSFLQRRLEDVRGLQVYVDSRHCTLVHIQFLNMQDEMRTTYDERGAHIVLTMIEERLNSIELTATAEKGVMLRFTEDSVILGWNVSGRLGNHSIRGTRAALSIYHACNLSESGSDSLNATVVVHTSKALCGFVGTNTTRAVVAFTRDSEILPALREASLKYRRLVTTPGVLPLQNYFVIRPLEPLDVEGDWVCCRPAERLIYAVEKEKEEGSLEWMYQQELEKKRIKERARRNRAKKIERLQRKAKANNAATGSAKYSMGGNHVSSVPPTLTSDEVEEIRKGTEGQSRSSEEETSNSTDLQEKGKAETVSSSNT